MRKGGKFAVAVCAILLLPEAATAGDGFVVLSGATALDGKSIENKDGQRYRLSGVDAPALDQHCRGQGGEDYACGVSSRDALAGMLKGIVTCDVVGPAQDGWNEVRCFNFLDLDIAAELVALGWAVPDRPNGMEYVFNEMEAEARDLGLWQGKFVDPRSWRAGNRM